MKKYLGYLIALAGALVSFSAFAEKIIVTGEPVIIEKKGDFYAPSTTVTTTHDYYYFTVDGTKKVCYKDAQPGLASIDAGIFAVKMGSDTVSLHCYEYSADYFVVE